MGDGSPDSREAEGEGGEGFYIAQKWQVPRFTCNLGWGGELRGGWFDVALPVLAGEHRVVTLTPVGCRRGEPG